MKRYAAILVTALLLSSCTPAPAAGPALTRAPAPAGESLQLRTTATQLAPFFAESPSPLPGVFVRKGDRLDYAHRGQHTHVLAGAQSLALAIQGDKALVTDGAGLFWYDWTAGALTEIPGLPAARFAARSGSSYVLLAEKQVLVWTPGEDPVELPLPEQLYGISGAAISPDGQYAAVAFDLDLPYGPRVGVAWAYDLQTGGITRWPAGDPQGQYGLWLLGWSGPHTLRFRIGVRGYDHGYTWELPDRIPDQGDSTDYSMPLGAWPNAAGTWLAYQPESDAVAIQSVDPTAKPIYVYKGDARPYNARILLNGHLAFLTMSPKAWWEVLPDGTLRRWDECDGLF